MSYQHMSDKDISERIEYYKEKLQELVNNQYKLFIFYSDKDNKLHKLIDIGPKLFSDISNYIKTRIMDLGILRESNKMKRD